VAGAGALLALVLAFLRRRPRGHAAAMLKMGAAGGAAGALLAGAIAFAIPARYVSTAVLRIRPGTGREVTARHVADYVRQETPVILSRSSLAELMQRPSLDLYRGERARHPMERVIDKMREDLRIEPPAPTGLRTTFSIAFTYTDRFKVQAVVHELVSKFVESQTNYLKDTLGLKLNLADEARLEVLDPASLPEAPVWPPRGGIITGGLLVGLLLGLVAAVIRRGPGRPGVDAAVSYPACASTATPARLSILSERQGPPLDGPMEEKPTFLSLSIPSDVEVADLSGLSPAAEGGSMGPNICSAVNHAGLRS
jgi:uncharacterized protein involved in exopolysaccharide biosynthesis